MDMTVLSKSFRDINTCEGEETLTQQVILVPKEISTHRS